MRNATRTIVATLGVIFGLGGMSHGFFEALQGNTPTNSLIIAAIGEAHRMWPYGHELAFTIIPNFLITGILAMLVGLTIIIWSLTSVHKKHGPLVFISLFIILFLVGGGIGQVIFFTIAWAVSTRINKPLTWWRKVLPESTRGVLAKLWRGTLIVSALLILFTLEIAIFGFVPGVNNPDITQTVMLSSLGLGLIVLLFTIVAGFAHDIEKQANVVG